jgi:hypothetical protein
MKKKYSEEVLSWCSDFENDVFISPNIETHNVHRLANEYIKLRNKFENKKYFITEIKRELFKRISSLSFFDGNKKLLNEELNGLFSAEFNYQDIDKSLSPFKKDIIKSAYKNDEVSEVNPQESNVLYDLGVADWDYVKSHFTHKINDAYLHEAVSWIVTFIKSNDYNTDDLIVKSENGKILKEDTFINILKKINEKSISGRPPFDLNKGKVYYNKLPNSSVSVKLWHEKEQRVYGGISTKMRDASDAYKSLDAFYYLSSENVIIEKMKSSRNESVVSAERVNELVRMRLYKDLRTEFFEKGRVGMPTYQAYEFFTNLDENFMVIKGFLNNDTYYKKSKNLNSEELKEVIAVSKMKKGCFFYGDLLNKSNSNKDIFAAMFMKNFKDGLVGERYLHLTKEASVSFFENLNIDFAGFKGTRPEDNVWESFMCDFLLKDKNSISNLTSLMSEKSVYKEERVLLYSNFKKIFKDINEMGLEDAIGYNFKTISEDVRDDLISTFKNRDFYKEFKGKVDEVKASQHESSVFKNLMMEEAFGVLINLNPSAVGNYMRVGDENELSSNFYAELSEWNDRFIEDVVLADDNNDLAEVIMDEYFILKNKHPSIDVVLLVKEMLLNDDRLVKNLPEKESRNNFILNIFKDKNSEIVFKENIKNLKKEIPFDVKLTSGFLENEKKITKWSFISNYFDNKVKKSTIKEANGWIVGFLKHGDYSQYKFSKSKNIKESFLEIIKQINKYSLTKKEPFKFDNNKILFQEAGSGEVDVEFWDVKNKKINGMSITRHQGVEIEGNQFMRHPIKLFVKSIILKNKEAFTDELSIKTTPIHNSDYESLLNYKLIKDKILFDIKNGDEFAKNLSISREFIRNKYGVNYHSSGYIISKNEMNLLVTEMNKTVNYSFFGEIRNKSSFPELNAGLTNIAYVENIKNIGNFKLSIKAAEIFMDNLNKYYNGVDKNADVDGTSKKIIFNLFRNNPLNESVIEYFSEPNSHKDERETLIQSIGVFIDKIRDEYDFCDDETLKESVNDFFSDSITEKEKDEFLKEFKSTGFFETLNVNLSNLKLSHGEPRKRYELLESKIKNMEELLLLNDTIKEKSLSLNCNKEKILKVKC